MVSPSVEGKKAEKVALLGHRRPRVALSSDRKLRLKYIATVKNTNFLLLPIETASKRYHCRVRCAASNV